MQLECDELYGQELLNVVLLRLVILDHDLTIQRELRITHLRRAKQVFRKSSVLT